MKSMPSAAAKLIRILHLSDLHWRARRFNRPSLKMGGFSGHDPRKAEDLMRAIKNLPPPDLTVITGDLSATGGKRSLQQVWEFITHDLRLDLRKICAVPGNHDRYHKDNWGHSPWMACASPFQVMVKDVPVFLFPFDSTCSGMARLKANRGGITPAQYQHFHRSQAELGGPARQPHEAYRSGLKIALLHHHPMPLPGKNMAALTFMPDGGSFLAEMQRARINLILHGHQHRDYACRVHYFDITDQPEPSDLVVVGAGSAISSRGTIGFNLIEIDPKTRQVWLRVYHWETASYRQVRYFRILDGDHDE